MSFESYTREQECGKPATLQRTFESYTREQECGKPATLQRTFESYTREQECGRPEKEDATKVIKELEANGTEKAKEILINSKNQTIEETQKSFVDLLLNGANKFKERTGREMTYAEMREAFG